jgi:hypothetical protein
VMCRGVEQSLDPGLFPRCLPCGFLTLLICIQFCGDAFLGFVSLALCAGSIWLFVEFVGFVSGALASSLSLEPTSCQSASRVDMHAAQP